jgi:hypothetical protein
MLTGGVKVELPEMIGFAGNFYGAPLVIVNLNGMPVVEDIEGARLVVEDNISGVNHNRAGNI